MSYSGRSDPQVSAQTYQLWWNTSDQTQSQTCPLALSRNTKNMSSNFKPSELYLRFINEYHMGGREVGLRSRWPALWIWGLSAVKWESTEWALRSLPASMGPDFTSQQGSCITGLRTFRLFPQAFEKYLRKIIFTVLLRNAFPSQCNSAF